MTARDDFDRRIAEGLRELAAPRIPEYLAAVQANARQSEQRPAWSFPGRWLPVDALTRRLAPVGNVAWLIVILALLLAALAVAFVGARPRLPAPVGPAENGFIVYDDGSDILAVDADGSDRRLLTAGTATETRPAVSPDGRRIAFLREGDGPTAVMVANFDGSDAVEIVAGDSTGALVFREAPAWAPDSRRIALSVLNTTAGVPRAEIWIVDTGTRERDVFLPSALFAAEHPAWSPAGDRIAFLGEPSRRAEAFLYVSALDGGGLTRVTDLASSAATGYWQLPRWSPDGLHLAAHHGDPGTTGRDIHVLATDHLQDEIVAGSDLDEAQPAWSPDGTHLAYWRSTGEFEWQVVVLDLATRTEQPLSFVSRDADSLFWAPDGTGITVLRCVTEERCELLLLHAFDPGAPPTVLAEVPPKSYETSTDQAYWSWQRRAP